MTQNKKPRKPAAAKGFTLIELAVVIAIIGVLAAVGINGMSGMNIAAERGVARDFETKLESGVSLYMARVGYLPPHLDNFVIATALTGAAPTAAVGDSVFPTVSTLGLGQALCGAPVANADTLTCTNTTFPNVASFTSGTAGLVYTYVPASGQLTSNIT